MAPSRLATAAGVALALAVSPGVCRAQVEFSSYVGLFAPASDLAELIEIREGPVSLTRVGVDTIVSRFEHQSAATVGARLTVWLSSLLGLEAEVSHTIGTVQRTVESTFSLERPRTTTDATLFTATGRALLRLGLSDASTIHLLGGIGVLQRGSDLYDEFRGTTDLTFVIGSGLSRQITPRIAIRLGLEDYLMSPGLHHRSPRQEMLDDFLPATEIRRRTENHVQHYLVLSSAVSISLSGL